MYGHEVCGAVRLAFDGFEIDVFEAAVTAVTDTHCEAEVGRETRCI